MRIKKQNYNKLEMGGKKQNLGEVLDIYRHFQRALQSQPL